MSRLAALLMAVALGAAACGSSDTTDTAAPAATGDSESSGDAAASSVLDITATTAAGDAIDLSEYAGQDLVLWFWAPW